MFPPAVTFVEQGLLPLAKTSLSIVTEQLKSVNETVTPYAVGIIEPLAEAQLANVLGLLYKSQLLANDVKTLGTGLLANGDERSFPPPNPLPPIPTPR